MKRQAVITGALAAAMVVLTFVGALCGALTGIAMDETLYGAQSRAAVAQAQGLDTEEDVTAYIGLTAQEQDALAQQIVLDLAYASGDQTLDTSALNAREVQHMRDVRGLVQAARRVYQLCVTLAAGLAIALAWTGAQLRKRHRAAALGMVCGLAVIAAASVVLAQALRTEGFETLFIGVHRLLFTNDLWLMDPETDLLIRMMPQTLFEQAAQAMLARTGQLFVLALALLTAVYAVVAGMVQRHAVRHAPPDTQASAEEP